MTLTDIEYTVRLAQTIKKHRKRLGMIQEQAAIKAGVQQSQWSQIEAGGRMPTLPTLRRCAHVLGLTLPELLEEVEEGD